MRIYIIIFTKPLYLYKDEDNENNNEYYDNIISLNNIIFDVYSIKNIKLLNSVI